MREGRTLSVCPVCQKRIPAERVLIGGDVYLKKRCSEHGEFSAIIWRGDSPSFDIWWSYNQTAKALTSDCPNACGLCRSHLNKTCCALVEITSRCNLKCPVCFAESGGESSEPSVSELFEIFKKLADEGNTFVQLSGGEPTVRRDLPEIIEAARRAGCDTVQLNSNGLRIGREPGYAKELADAGLSFVFMQFDGVTEAPYAALRGENLLGDKLRAIDECGGCGLGVTLVPTLVPRVNGNEIGAIVELACSRSPVVRGVHFQPVSYFGRYPQPPRDEDRITIPEVLTAIETQTGGKFKIGDFIPSSCDHPRCGFHGDFVILPHGKIMKLTKKYDPDACCCVAPEQSDAHLKNRAFVARRWKRSVRDERAPADISGDAPDMSAFLSRVKSHGFTVTAMAFQDAWTLELERLRKCSLHVISDGKTVPFCANYLTGL
ncbi:MAG: radical SAM protein [Clostridiales bacterium]|nr:radical SAM protein [Clostridiales bacterium]